MGKPISSVAGASSPISTTQLSGSEPTQSTDSPSQSSPTQSAPSKPEPLPTIWPPANGFRRSATEGNREAHNGWQEQWMTAGPRITNGVVDTVAALKPMIEPLLQHGSRGRWA